MLGNESNIDRLLKSQGETPKELHPHRTPLTVLFTDVVGSTAYFDRYGDTAGVEMLERHTDVASETAAEFQGKVIKTIGDSVMAEFPAPAHAVRAAVEMQRRLARLNQTLPERDRIQLRIGINSGSGIRRRDDVFGDAVNVAARITKKTGPAQILISRAVRDAILPDSDLRCTWLGKFSFAGKAEKEDIFEVVWTDRDTYGDLRARVTAALARGELVSPGLRAEDLAQPSHAGTPVPAEEPTLDLPSSPAQAGLAARYDLLGEVGSGGMGIVYKARDRETSELVALKVLKPEVAADQRMMERFINELRLARKITHKNVCRMHEFNRAGSSAYISMEFVEGESLRAVLKRFGTLPPRKGVQIARQICSALREAHAQGTVHRDLKPENVMVDQAGDVKVMDFGIARSVGAGTTTTGAFIGTPAYMAPEQAEGKPVDHRADIYSFGLVLYEMFCGVPAFSGDTAMGVALKQIQETPLPPSKHDPSVPTHVEKAIIRCLEKDPAKRYQSVDELESALLSQPVHTPTPAAVPAPAPARSPAPARPPSLIAPAPEPTRSRAWLVVTGLLVAAGFVVYWALFSGRGGFFPSVDTSPEQSSAESLAQEESSAGLAVEPPVPEPPPPIEAPPTSGTVAESDEPAGNLPPAPVAPAGFPPEIMLGSAMKSFEDGNYDLARRQFEEFLRANPDSDYADDALLATGESYGRQQDYRKAIASFDRLLQDYPEGDRVPMARLRKADALWQLGQGPAAVEELRTVSREYPGTDEARSAQEVLTRLRGRMGVRVQDIAPQMSRRLQLGPDQGGVMVRSVERGSFGDQVGLRRGDIIMEVNGRRVRNAVEFAALQRSVTPGTDVVMRIKRRRGGRGFMNETLRGTIPFE